VIVSAHDVLQSKPHPEVFLKAAELLGVAPDSCIVFEDAPKGVEAAETAGMQSVVLTTMHTSEEFKRYSNIMLYTKDYKNPLLKELIS
jgi:beta-phosphoglucomutase-like phosphatase (HAD superfamily)